MSQALNSNIGVSSFVKAMLGRAKNVMASTLTDEEKLREIIDGAEKEVQEKRKLAREIGVQMRAIADPATEKLEPLEAIIEKRKKLVQLGSTMVDDPKKKSQLGQISQEMNSLANQISAQQKTYDTLEESYKVATATYKEALAALETIRQNAPAMLNAIEANKQALEMRDRARNQNGVDTSFLTKLEAELSNSQAEMHSDLEIENDLDGTNSFNIDAALEKLDAADTDEALMNEFRAAKKA